MSFALAALGLCSTSGCFKHDDTLLDPKLGIVSGTTIAIANHNSWDWENVSIILNPKDVSTSNWPKHGQYVMQYKGFLWQTKRIKAGQTVTVKLSSFVDNQGKHLARGSLPSGIEIETFQSKNKALASYTGDLR